MDILFCVRLLGSLINVLRAAFTLVDPESVKRYWQLDWVLTLWGATGVKALPRTLMKSGPGVNFINVLRAAFRHADPESAKGDSQVVSLFCTFGICNITKLELPLISRHSRWHCVQHSPVSSTKVYRKLWGRVLFIVSV
jgi:hypothetical protein